MNGFCLKLNILSSIFFLLILSCAPGGGGDGGGGANDSRSSSVVSPTLNTLSPSDFAAAQQQIDALKAQAGNSQDLINKLQSNRSGLLNVISDQSSSLSQIIESFIKTVLLNSDSISPELASTLKSGLEAIKSQIEASQTTLVNSLNNLNSVDMTTNSSASNVTYSATLRDDTISTTSATNGDNATSDTLNTSQAVSLVFGALNKKISIVIDSITQKEITYANYQINQMLTALSAASGPDFATFENAAVLLAKSGSWLSLKDIKNDQTFQNTVNSGLSLIQDLISNQENQNNEDFMTALKKAQFVLSSFQSNNNSDIISKLTLITNKLNAFKSLVISIRITPDISVSDFNNSLDEIALDDNIKQINDLLDELYAANPQIFTPSIFTDISKTSQDIKDTIDISLPYLVNQKDGSEITNEINTNQGYIQTLVDKLDIYYTKSDLMARVNTCNKDLQTLSTVSTSSFVNALTEAKINNTDDIVNGILNSNMVAIANVVLEKRKDIITAQSLTSLKQISSDLYKLCTEQYASILNNLGQINVAKINALTNKISSLQTTRTNLLSSQDNLETQISNLTNQLQTSVSNGITLTDTLSSTQSSLVSKIQELNQLKDNLNGVNSQLLQTQMDKDSLNTQLINKSAALQNSQDQFTALTESYQNLQQHSADQDSQIQTLQTNLSTVQQQLADSQALSVSLQNQLSSSQANYNDVLNQKTDLANQLAVMQTQLTQAQTNNATDINTIDTLTQSIAATTSQLDAANQNIADLQGQISTLNSQLTIANNTIDAKNSTISSLQSQLASTQSQLSTSQANLAATQSSLATAQSNYTTAQNSLTTLQNNLTSFLNSINTTLSSAQGSGYISNYVSCTTANFASCYSSVASAVSNLLAQTNALNTKITNCKNNSANTYYWNQISDYDTNGMSTKLNSVTFYESYCPTYLLY